MKNSGLKLIVQIPAYNEQDSIGEVIESVPRKIPGINKVEVLVINKLYHKRDINIPF